MPKVIMAALTAFAFMACSASGFAAMCSVASNSPAACAASVTLFSRVRVRATRMRLRFNRWRIARNFAKKG